MNSEFERVYQQHWEAVYRYTVRLVGNRELAEDITSEAFLEFYRNRQSIDTARMPAWLFTVARNRAVDHWRKYAAERRYLDSLRPPSPHRPPGFQLETWLSQESSLKPVHRTCLTLHFFHGMTRAEIAQRLAITEIKVKGHLQYALQLLRKAWDSAGGLHGF